MSKKVRIEHDLLSERPEFKGLTREELMKVVTLPLDLPNGVVGKYHMRVEAAQKKASFCTPNWIFGKLVIKEGPYKPKTKRCIFDLIQQSAALFGPEGITGEELVRFLYHNVDMRDQRSPYTEGRPCIPWIEDYISGAIAEKIGFLSAEYEDGREFEKARKKK